MLKSSSMGQPLTIFESSLTRPFEGGTDRTGSLLKAGLHLGPDCGL